MLNKDEILQQMVVNQIIYDIIVLNNNSFLKLK